MKIQTRQSIYGTIAFGVVFICISVLIFFFYSSNLHKSLHKNLEKTAHIVALFHLEEDELNAKDFENVRIQFEKVVSSAHYIVINEFNAVEFGEKDDAISSEILNKIRREEQAVFSTDTDFYYGIFYEDNQGDFIIITKEPKETLNRQLIPLLWILISALIVGLLAVVLLSRWLAKVAYKPFSRVIEQVRNISFGNTNTQIDSPNTNDELQELTETFNHLLEQISETFVIQKNFVNYVSHEFKTPLAAMLGNLEVFSLKDRNPEEYSELSQKLISQVHQLEEIINTLIAISDLRKEDEISTQIRIDELVWEIIEKIGIRYPNPLINARIDIAPEDENSLTVAKDRTQLLMALFNIVENAVKFSQGKAIDITLFKKTDKLHLSVRDRGIGIPKTDLENIDKPLFRADNTGRIQGSGIGLSIALRILEKNKIRYTIQSTMGDGTEVCLIF